jgi:hypothetical protein
MVIDRLSLHYYSLCFCASYQTSKCKILLTIPAWINSNVMTSFLIVLLPISMVGLESYCFPISILTRQQVYTIVLAISGALSRNKTVVGANSHWSFFPDLTSWLLTLRWMAGVSYSVPINPHVAAAHAIGVSILTEIFYCLQTLLCIIRPFLKPPALPQVVLFNCNDWAEFIYITSSSLDRGLLYF